MESKNKILIFSVIASCLITASLTGCNNDKGTADNNIDIDVDERPIMADNAETYVYEDINGETAIVSFMEINEKNITSEIKDLTEIYNSLQIDEILNNLEDINSYFYKLKNSKEELNDWISRYYYIDSYLTIKEKLDLAVKRTSIEELNNLISNLEYSVHETYTEEYENKLNEYYAGLTEDSSEDNPPEPLIDDIIYEVSDEYYKSLIQNLQNNIDEVKTQIEDGSLEENLIECEKFNREQENLRKEMEG